MALSPAMLSKCQPVLNDSQVIPDRVLADHQIRWQFAFASGL